MNRQLPPVPAASTSISKVLRAALLTLPIFFALASVSTPFAAQSTTSGSPPGAVRRVHFDYHTEIGPFTSGAKRVEAWIPLPRDDAFQAVDDLSIQAAAAHEIAAQTKDGNRVLYVHADAPLPASIAVTISFDVTRRAEVADPSHAPRGEVRATDPAFGEALAPNALVPITGRIAEISASLGEQGASPYRQARVIYEYVTSIMKYDKSGKGWGRGDAIFACDIRRGNCTDFHSLFIALARARGIPARFTIGFPLGRGPAGTIPGYHCWAEFYARGTWIPVDASEAWQNPRLHDYYFGHLDADRVAFTMGRDLELTPRQHGGPVNFLVYPYVEVDGAVLGAEAIRNQFSYRNVESVAGGGK